MGWLFEVECAQPEGLLRELVRAEPGACSAHRALPGQRCHAQLGARGVQAHALQERPANALPFGHQSDSGSSCSPVPARQLLSADSTIGLGRCIEKCLRSLMLALFGGGGRIGEDCATQPGLMDFKERSVMPLGMDVESIDRSLWCCLPRIRSRPLRSSPVFGGMTAACPHFPFLSRTMVAESAR